MSNFLVFQPCIYYNLFYDIISQATHPELANKLDDFISKLRNCLIVKVPFTVVSCNDTLKMAGLSLMYLYYVTVPGKTDHFVIISDFEMLVT